MTHEQIKFQKMDERWLPRQIINKVVDDDNVDVMNNEAIEYYLFQVEAKALFLSFPHIVIIIYLEITFF